MIALISITTLIFVLIIGGFSFYRFYKNGFIPAKYLEAESKKGIQKPEPPNTSNNRETVPWIKEYYESSLNMSKQ